MNLTEIRKAFEQRKYNLIRTLENGRDHIELSKQHQMYGAIKELETILKIVDYHRKQEAESNVEFRLSKEENKSMLKKISLKLKRNENKILLNQ